eukprot:18478-Heterococcus_DN1.PRE.1
MADAEDETWEDWEEGEDECVSLFAQAVCPSGQAALARDKADYGFDLAAVKAKLDLDLYGMIKVVNFVRSRVAAAGGASKELAAALIAEIAAVDSTVLQGDKYLQPFLEDDALLFSLDQLAFDSDSDGEDDDTITKPLQQLAVTDGTSSSSSTATINGSSSSSSGTDAS